MKKIFLSLLFLLLVSVSAESFAAGCSGTPTACTARGTQSSCGTAATTGCTWTAGGTPTECAGTTPLACTNAALSTESACKANGCFWTAAGDANSNAFVTTMCNALKIVTGSGGKAFAAFAIISVGIGFFTGKISWGLMIGITAGIAAMFGAPTIVAAISGGSALDCGS